MLCAADQDVAHPEVTVEFGPWSLLIAFTDGLFERAGENMSVGYERLYRAWKAPPANLDRYADTILAAAPGR